MSRIALFIILSIGIFFFYSVFWFLTDPRTKKERLPHYFNPKNLLLSTSYIVFFISQLLNIMYYPHLFFANSSFFIIVGIILYTSGLLLASWAKTTMKSYCGTPFQHDIKRQNTLVTTGPFQFTRNPIYMGLLLTCLGFFLALQSYFIISTVGFFIYFYLSILKEEKLLTKFFKKKYLLYKSLVPRFF